MSVVKVVCECEECVKEGERKTEHMGRGRLAQYIPFSVSRGECQEPDPKSSAMCSPDSSIKMLYLYHSYPAHYMLSFRLALLPYKPSLLWKQMTAHSPASTHTNQLISRRCSKLPHVTCCGFIQLFRGRNATI